MTLASEVLSSRNPEKVMVWFNFVGMCM
jgi:hypothetical protein